MRVWHIENGFLAEGEPSGGEPLSARIEVLELGEVDLEGASHVVREAFRQLAHAFVPFVERMPEAAAGVIAAPLEQVDGAPPVDVGLLLEPGRLRLFGETEACARALSLIAQERVPVPSAAGVLCEFMRLTVRDHPAFLSSVRRDFEQLEERLLEGRRCDRGKMMADSRRLMGFDTLYQGMSDIAAELSEDGGDLLSDGDRLRLRSLGRLLDRLATRLESLQDYSLQLNSLYQEGIDIRQNNVMQWLTVIATIFMPLTFITGWYGMNFPTMAMLQRPWGYPLVVVVCVLIATAEILFFRRHGWLHFGGRAHPRRRGSHRRRSS